MGVEAKLRHENMVFKINCLWSCMETIIFIFVAAEAQRDTAKSRTNDIPNAIRYSKL